MMASANVPIGVSEDTQPIISLTFCMMSCVLQTGSAFYLPSIADNLAILADHPHLDANFRRVCHRLWEHWETHVNSNSSPLAMGDCAGSLATRR